MFLNIINNIGEYYPLFKKINTGISSFLGFLLAYKTIYSLVGVFFTRKFKPAKKKHKYAIVIAARNEEAVIANLLNSIKEQDYPKELITTFVVADNCTDKTAEIAKKKGAIVYKRFDNEHKTKGFALQYLFDKIEEDYGRMSFEGYFVFDADNLLNKDYVSKMNDAFDSGEKIITSYRNSKNFDENWIAANYALHWLRSIRSNHRARSVFRLATNIQGTGFLFSNEIVKDGWKYTSLTEDRALTADAVAQGYQITYNDEAMFFDEQPTTLKIALRQRLRWSKGHLLAFKETGPYLFMNIFLGKKYIKTKWNNENNKKMNKWENIIESIRHRFASFDTLMQLTPISVFNLIRWIIVSFIIYSAYTYNNGIVINKLFNIKFLNNLFNINFNFNKGVTALLIGLIYSLWLKFIFRFDAYFNKMISAIYLFFIERKRIIKIPLYKKIIDTITWPIFDIIGRYTTYIALFVKVSWKPIPHNSKITIHDLKVK